ncbi:hypothetical protein D9758_002311 [Tetrapyrgos nigripes]|uniref:RRM domain-containing protein n=1 Tax=Tetrapyrgos nigripes TaxID=182062 RepID=A0A8H5GPJ8_9AGAR|nr:hypothetical protein D9758_002311 [Tetrapyrgos nigripes]
MIAFFTRSSSMSSTQKLTKKQKKAIAFRERKSKGPGSNKNANEDDMGGNEVPEMEIQEYGDGESVEMEVEDVEAENDGNEKKKKKNDKNNKNDAKSKSDSISKSKGSVNVLEKPNRKANAKDKDKDGNENAVVSAGKKRKRVDVEGEDGNEDEGNVEKLDGKPSKKKKSVDDKSRYILFVGNLKYTTSVEAIQSHFSACDPPPTVRLLTPKVTSSTKTVAKSKGCAFLEFSHPHALQQALKLHHSQLDGRSINVELTAGGGGNSESRLKKVKERNSKLIGQRTEKIGKKKKEDSGTSSHPQRFSATSGVEEAPDTKRTWSIGDAMDEKTHRGGKKHARPSKKSKSKDWGTGVNAIPVG